MTVIDERTLSGLLKEDSDLRSVEPYIYSVYQNFENTNSYDKKFGSIYDWVACNSLYNRLIWGYSIGDFALLTQEALESSKEGFVLDAGCGSLAFTAKTYGSYLERPVVLLDQSLKLLKIAKSRLMKIKRNIPSNIIFLHGDALSLPFQPGTFQTIISLNLLHVLKNLGTALNGLKYVLAEGGTMTFTSLVRNDRFADRYLKIWENAGEVVSRDISEIRTVFEHQAIPINYDIKGNMAFLRLDRFFTEISDPGPHALDAQPN
jgi:ubiquinone/menaquinone biosynthesis C-methylase UbiE